MVWILGHLTQTTVASDDGEAPGLRARSHIQFNISEIMYILDSKIKRQQTTSEPA